MKNLFRSVIYKVMQNAFKRRFYSFGHRSGFGSKGFGNSCIIKGTNRISIGQESWFGNQTEIIVYNQNDRTNTEPFLIIRNNVSCTGRCRITCAGRITIGDSVLVAPDVFITDHNHGMNPEIAGGYSKQPLIVKDVHIEEGVWLGQRVCVLPGVTIGAHSIIGANSVVTHDIPPYSIAVGAPARVVKQWNTDLKEWNPVIHERD